MNRRKMIIRNSVIGDPIDFYIEIKEKNTKRRSAVLERMPKQMTAIRTARRTGEERSVLS